MHVKEHLNDLLHHMAWGDALLWAIALEGNGASPAYLERAHHTHLVQHAFLTLLTDTPFTHTKPEDYATPADLMTWGKQQIKGLLRYTELMRPAALAQRHQIPWFDENQSHPTELEMLTQVAMHTQHHANK